MAYLDRISIAPLLPDVTRAMADCLAWIGLNPNSPTRMGSKARQALDKAREQTANLIEADPRDLTFVATGTESVNLAIRGLVHSAAKSRNERKILVSAIEHSSVMNTVRSLQKEGFESVVIPVDSQGVIDLEFYKKALDSGVLLASVQMANPEIGTMQNIPSLACLAREHNVLFHTDAVDAAGWMPIDVDRLHIDALSFAGTQLGGPPGAAALYIRKGVSIVPMLNGGIQERHRRPGLENIPAVVGMGIACQHAKAKMTERNETKNHLVDRLKSTLRSIEDVVLTGHPEYRIPGHVSALIRYVEGEALLLLLDMKNIQAASGSSCTAKDLKISPVLLALGIEHTDAQGSIVFSLCNDTTENDIILVENELPDIVKRLRAMSPLWPG
ncbi:cysteine desulfurase [bacterium]|nr:cysteine desulfurase [candidate division CSSED10-310 bacterium]